jgi:hypothetical protein
MIPTWPERATTRPRYAYQTTREVRAVLESQGATA